jgi:glycosyltransferase involved in cell wall biosynthesis
MKLPSVGWKPFMPGADVASVRVRCLVPMQLMAERQWRTGIFDSADATAYDVVVFQKAYRAEDLELARRLSANGVKVVFDLCDNHFFNPEERPDLFDRTDRLRQMIALVDAVTVSSPLLRALVQKEQTFVVDDALDSTVREAPRSPLQRLPRWGRGAHLVWFGNVGSESPRFGIVDLAHILPDLNRLHRRVPFHLTVITGSKEAFNRYLSEAQFATRYRRWTRRTFGSILSRADVSLLPITMNPFTVCKTSNRVVTSLMLGVPVVADLIPSYEEFVPYILVSGWEDHLERYASSPELRQQHVREGQEFIARRFAPEVIVGQWTKVFRSLVE